MTDSLTYLLSFGLSFAATAAITPLVIRACWMLMALDRPDARKTHRADIPRLGGVAVMAGFASGVVLTLWMTGIVRDLFGPFRYHWIGWVGAVVGLFACGVVDDLRPLSAPVKLAVQIAAGVGVFAAGFRIDHIVLPWVGSLDLHLLALPATLLWIVAVTNAINLIDGLDGLATGIGLMMTATVAAISYQNGIRPVTVLSLALAGSLLGFLPYNFNPARVFLGDSGSQFLGFTLAVISIRGTQKSATLVAIMAPILLLGLPILDTILVVLRRTWRIQGSQGSVGPRARLFNSRGVFQADREHIHHNLLELGLSDRKAVLVLYITSAAFCLASFAMVAMKNPSVAIAMAFTLAVGTILVKSLAVRRRIYVPPRVVTSLETHEEATPAGSPSVTAPAGAKLPRAGGC